MRRDLKKSACCNVLNFKQFVARMKSNFIDERLICTEQTFLAQTLTKIFRKYN